MWFKKVSVRLPVAYEPESFLRRVIVLSKFLHKICAVASSRSVSLLISGQKKPAKTDKNDIKKTSITVPVGKLHFFTVQAWVITQRSFVAWHIRTPIRYTYIKAATIKLRLAIHARR